MLVLSACGARTTGATNVTATSADFDAATTPDPGADDIGSVISFRQVTGAIPEPSTWAMMLLGFAVLGVSGWRKVKQARAGI